MRAFDFFCGAGGLTCGLQNAGITVVAGIDKDERCYFTYSRNNLSSQFFHRDINNLELSELGIDAPMANGNNVLFAGCAPCQPFSSHIKGSNRRPDALLLLEFGRLVQKATPDYVLVENVPGMARVSGYSIFRRFTRMLDSLDYQHVHGILDAQHFGVPQRRRRLVLLASRRKMVSFPKPTHGRGLLSIRTVREAIGGFPPISAGECHSTIANHVASRISELNLRRLRATPLNGGDRRSWPAALRLACHQTGHSGHTDVYGRMFWDAPAPALTSRCDSISNGRYGHPEQDRAISLREAATLQSFPLWYEFFGCKKSIALQIGNAVPVKLAEEIGRHILRLSTDNIIENNFTMNESLLVMK